MIVDFYDFHFLALLWTCGKSTAANRKHTATASADAEAVAAAAPVVQKNQ